MHGFGDPLNGKLRLRLVRKGFKRLDQRRRGSTNKLAATAELLLEVIVDGGLDENKWDDAVLLTAMVFGFFKLRRSGEFLRKGAEPDADKCVRVGDCTLASNGEEVELGPEAAKHADELIAVQRTSKADQDWKGAATNTFSCSDKRLCVVARFKRLLNLRPGHFKDPSRFLFTLSNGKVLSRDTMSAVLKRERRASALGWPEST
jgi:hypothetical protein